MTIFHIYPPLQNTTAVRPLLRCESMMNKAISRIAHINFAAVFFILYCINSAAEEPVYTPQNTQKRILANGMTVILHETRRAPLVSVDVLVKCGSAAEARYGGSGISHLVEHLIFKSGDEKEANAAVRQIKSFGGTINAFTARDYTVYTAVVPSRYAAETLAILKKFIFFPSFDVLDIEKEKGVVLDEIRKGRDDPDIFASDMAWSLVFQKHPYRYPVIGHEDVFTRLCKADIEDYFYRSYTPDNVVMAVSGDIDKQSIFEEIEKLFSALKRNFAAGAGAGAAEPPQIEKRSRIEYRSAQLARGVLSYRGPSISDAGLYALDILSIVLGKGENSILNRELRDDKKIVYAVSCSNYTLRDAGIFCVSFASEPDKAAAAVSAAMAVLKKVAAEGVSAGELEKAKKAARTEFIESLQTSGGRSADLALSEALTENCRFSLVYLDRLSAVTNEDVKAAAAFYLNQSKANIALLLPDGCRKINSAAAGAAPKKNIGRDISRHVLLNGARVIVCEDRSLPICTISAVFLGGVRFETKANNGISRLSSHVMLDGTAQRSEEEIKAAIESAGGDIGALSGANSFGITMNLMGADWKMALGILSDVIRNPAFDGGKIEKEKSLALAAIKERDDDIVARGLLLFKQKFFGASPYGLDPLGEPQAIRNIKRDDIVSYHRAYARPSNMVLTAAGDIDKNEFLEEAKKLFGTGAKINAEFPVVPAKAGPPKREEASDSMEREQSIILIGFPAVKITDNDRYAFEVIGSVMSGSDGRLFNNVRGSLGMAYSTGSLFIPGIEPGCHIFYAATKSGNIDVAKEAILKEIRRLRAELIPDDELTAAKESIKTYNIMGMEENKSLNLRMALDELYGLGCRNFEVYGSKIDDVTAGQVRRVANQYLDADNCLIVTICGTGRSVQ